MPLTNRVASSGLQLIEPQRWLDGQQCMSFDVAPGLDRGMVLREKEFRRFLVGFDWSPFTHQPVAVHCSTPAILPAWTFLLVGRHLLTVGARPFVGSEHELRVLLALEQIQTEDFSRFMGQRVVIKGCGDEKSDRLSLALLVRLQPIALSILYGEPCSTVPIYKKGI